MINSVANYQNSENIYSEKIRAKAVKEEESDKKENVKSSSETLQNASKENINTYKKPKYTVDTETVDRLKNEINNKNQQLADIVSKLLNNQKSADENLRYLLSGGTIFADAKTIQGAKDAISEDGEFGVKKTAERILNFAKAISGGDPSKIEKLREAVQKGFQAVAGMCKDGNLPSICNDTYDKVMEGFDAWEKESKEKS